MKKRNKTYVFFRRDGKLTANDRVLIPILKANGAEIIVRDFADSKNSRDGKFRVEWFEEANKLAGGAE